LVGGDEDGCAIVKTNPTARPWSFATVEANMEIPSTLI
jgi:hypothetical protein